jgi:hypothetical protein
MVIGNGSIANVFNDFKNEEYIIFASGVSNSKEKDNKNFEREEILLKKTIQNFPNRIIVYFSTVSIYTKKSQYVLHKLKMENILKKSQNFLIIRVPQLISESGNKNNLINFFIDKIKNNEIIYIEKNSERSILDVEDLKKITLFLIQNKIKNQCLNFSGFQFLKVTEILKIIEELLNLNSNTILLNKESKIYKHSSWIFNKFSINLDINYYTKNIIKKYINKKLLK